MPAQRRIGDWSAGESEALEPRVKRIGKRREVVHLGGQTEDRTTGDWNAGEVHSRGYRNLVPHLYENFS